MTGALQIRKTITDRQENLSVKLRENFTNQKFHQFQTIHETDTDITKIKLKCNLPSSIGKSWKLSSTVTPETSSTIQSVLL